MIVAEDEEDKLFLDICVDEDNLSFVDCFRLLQYKVRDPKLVEVAAVDEDDVADSKGIVIEDIVLCPSSFEPRLSLKIKMMLG